LVGEDADQDFADGDAVMTGPFKGTINVDIRDSVSGLEVTQMPADPAR
jgi:hypothetical protein